MILTFCSVIGRSTLCSDERCLVEAMHRRVGGELEVIGAEAGMHLVALLPPGVSDVAISRRATEMRISAISFSTCYGKPPGRGVLILGYGGAGARQVHDWVGRLAMSF